MFKFFKKLILELVSAEYSPEDLVAQLPVRIQVLKQLPGKDTPNYYLAACQKPIIWQGQAIHYVVVGARFQGVSIKPGVGEIALNVAYVIDESIVRDKAMDLLKCRYVAVCVANEVS